MAQLIQTLMMSALGVGTVAKPVLPSAPGHNCWYFFRTYETELIFFFLENGWHDGRHITHNTWLLFVFNHVVVQSQKTWSKNYKGHRHFKYNDADDAMGDGVFHFSRKFDTPSCPLNLVGLNWIEWIDARTLVGVGVSTVSRKVPVKVLFPGRVSQEVILILIYWYWYWFPS